MKCRGLTKNSLIPGPFFATIEEEEFYAGICGIRRCPRALPAGYAEDLRETFPVSFLRGFESRRAARPARWIGLCSKFKKTNKTRTGRQSSDCPAGEGRPCREEDTGAPIPEARQHAPPEGRDASIAPPPPFAGKRSGKPAAGRRM